MMDLDELHGEYLWNHEIRAVGTNPDADDGRAGTLSPTLMIAFLMSSGMSVGTRSAIRGMVASTKRKYLTIPDALVALGVKADMFSLTVSHSMCVKH